MRTWIAFFFATLSGCATYTDVDRDARITVFERLDLSPDPLEEDLYSGKLDADAAARIALAKNPAAQIPLAELGIARAALIAETAPENPRAGAEANFPREGSAEIELEVTQSITSLIYSAWARSIGEDEIAAAKLRAAAEVLDVVHQARTTFFRHQADLERAALAETVLAASQASFDVAEALHQAGNLADLAYYNERDQLERAKLATERAAQQAAQSRVALERMLGAPAGDKNIVLEARLPEPSAADIALEKAEQVAIGKSLELAAIEHRIEAVADRASLSRTRGLLPDVEIGAGATRAEEEHGWTFGPKLEIALPLFDRGQGERQRAEAELASLRLRRDAEQIEIKAAVREAAIALKAAESRVAAYRDRVLPLRQKIVEETQAAVNAMFAGVFELLRAKRDQVRAADEYVSELERYWLAREALDQLLRGGSNTRAQPEIATETAGERDNGGH